MPPSNQVAGAVAAPAILQPGDRIVRDAAGMVSGFGKFAVISQPAQAREAMGTIIGVYSDGGVGKTTFFCSICDRKLNPEGHDLPMLILDAEAGVKSVAHLLGPDLQDIPLRSVYDLEDWIDLARAQPKDKFPWKSVYLDNLSDLVGKALSEQGLHNKANAGPGMTSSQPDYNAMTTRLTQVLHDLKDLALDYGFNLFISLWEQTEKTAGGDIIGYRADINPKLATRVRGMLDYIGYMTVLKTQVVVNGKALWVRKLDFSPNPEQDSKWRVTPEREGEVPFEMYNPTLPTILNTIKRGVPFPPNAFKKPVGSTGK